MRVFSAMLMPLLLTVSAAAQEVEVTDNPIADIVDETEIGSGVASYYGNELAGNRTASGERFDPGQLTAAHRSLPFGSMVRVTNTSNGDSGVVRINDRGPFSRGRVIDVSTAAAREIGMHRSGTARVKLALLNDD
jgi:rare lipoprotein A